MSTNSMNGLIALMGGNEFRADCREMDADLLAIVGVEQPKVVIIPTAANEHSQLAVQNGIEYFKSLGATVSGSMILDRTGAESPALVQTLKDADVLYLTGGNPVYLLQALVGTLAEDAIR